MGRAEGGALCKQQNGRKQSKNIKHMTRLSNIAAKELATSDNMTLKSPSPMASTSSLSLSAYTEALQETWIIKRSRFMEVDMHNITMTDAYKDHKPPPPYLPPPFSQSEKEKLTTRTQPSIWAGRKS
jgi:hypothetical protein